MRDDDRYLVSVISNEFSTRATRWNCLEITVLVG